MIIVMFVLGAVFGFLTSSILVSAKGNVDETSINKHLRND